MAACVLVLDTKGSLLGTASAGGGGGRKTGGGGKSPALLSSSQWDAVHKALKDAGTQVVVLVSDVPFVLEAEAGDTAGSLSSPFYWCAHPDELRRLLETLFQWKHKAYPGREVVLLSAGPGFGTTGDVWDKHLGLSIPLAIVGPVLGRVCAPGGWALKGSLADGRFSYAYRPPSDHWTCCSLEMELGEKPSVDMELLGVPVPPGTAWP